MPRKSVIQIIYCKVVDINLLSSTRRTYLFLDSFDISEYVDQYCMKVDTENKILEKRLDYY